MSLVWTTYTTELQVGLRTTSSLLYQYSNHGQSALNGNERNPCFFISLIFLAKILLYLCYFLIVMGEEVKDYWAVTYSGCRKKGVVCDLNNCSKEVQRLMSGIRLNLMGKKKYPTSKPKTIPEYSSSPLLKGLFDWVRCWGRVPCILQ